MSLQLKLAVDVCRSPSGGIKGGGTGGTPSVLLYFGTSQGKSCLISDQQYMEMLCCQQSSLCELETCAQTSLKLLSRKLCSPLLMGSALCSAGHPFWTQYAKTLVARSTLGTTPQFQSPMYMSGTLALTRSLIDFIPNPGLRPVSGYNGVEYQV